MCAASTQPFSRTLTSSHSLTHTLSPPSLVCSQAYVEHFTGIRPLYLPTLANYITARYRPLPFKPVLIARSHHALGRRLLTDLRRASRNFPRLKVNSIEEAYPGNAAGGGYEYSQLASHPAIVVVPYTKSTMTFFELYRIGIPIFVPSLSLLVKWELQRHVMSERVYWRHTPSPLRHPNTPDPNSLQDRKAVEYWLKLSDPYVYPHIQVHKPSQASRQQHAHAQTPSFPPQHSLLTPSLSPTPLTHTSQYFDSADDLAAKLATTDLKEVSSKMRRHYGEMLPVMRQKWKAILRKLFHNKPHGSWPTGRTDFDQALRDRFGLELSGGEPSCHRMSAPDQGQWN